MNAKKSRAKRRAEVIVETTLFNGIEKGKRISPREVAERLVMLERVFNVKSK